MVVLADAVQIAVAPPGRPGFTPGAWLETAEPLPLTCRRPPTRALPCTRASAAVVRASGPARPTGSRWWGCGGPCALSGAIVGRAVSGPCSTAFPTWPPPTSGTWSADDIVGACTRGSPGLSAGLDLGGFWRSGREFLRHFAPNPTQNLKSPPDRGDRRRSRRIEEIEEIAGDRRRPPATAMRRPAILPGGAPWPRSPRTCGPGSRHDRSAPGAGRRACLRRARNLECRAGRRDRRNATRRAARDPGGAKRPAWRPGRGACASPTRAA